jgi:hypothetical protein
LPTSTARKARVQHHRAGAAARQGEQQQQEIRPVGQEHRHPVARPDPGLRQPARHPPHLRRGRRPIHAGEGDAVRMAGGGAFQKLGQGGGPGHPPMMRPGRRCRQTTSPQLDDPSLTTPA